MTITTTITLYRLNRLAGAWSATIDGKGTLVRPSGRRAPSAQVAIAICGMLPSAYIAGMEAWRPLDLHKDWLPWPGATTRGNHAR